MSWNVSCAEGLSCKLKLSLYRTFSKKVGFKHGVSDTRSRLLFKFRSGTHGLNEELGRHGADYNFFISPFTSLAADVFHSST